MCYSCMCIFCFKVYLKLKFYTKKNTKSYIDLNRKIPSFLFNFPQSIEFEFFLIHISETQPLSSQHVLIISNERQSLFQFFFTCHAQGQLKRKNI